MAKHKQSELISKLAIEGVVAAIAGTVRGQFPVTPRALGESERAELGFSQAGDFLFYPVDDAGVFFYSDGAFTTMWYAGADCDKAISVLDAAIKKTYPHAKTVSDGPHKSERGFGIRTYDIKLGNGALALVEAIFPLGQTADPKFTVRVTAMAIKH